MSDNKITTLSEFLDHSGAKYRVFDMGRRVVKLSSEQFLEFESAKQPYPQPLQKSALFGVIFWNPTLPEKHYIWFLKFPLDEQGLLIQAARDEFLVMLLDRVGECMLAATDGNTIEGALKDSPYTFKPRDDKMAAFNAKASKSLARPPSSYYQHALDYFTGQKDRNDWPSLAMQGVADVAERLAEGEQTQRLIASLPTLPSTPLTVLSSFLEHTEPAVGIVEVLSHSVDSELQQQQPNIATLCACLRAASNSPAQGLLEQMVIQILSHDCSRQIEILATISGRLWQVLEQAPICTLFVERLAENDADYSGFSQVLADAMYMPGLRQHIMKALRSPERSDMLSKRVGEMFGQVAS
jgi:hypothetical protein